MPRRAKNKYMPNHSSYFQNKIIENNKYGKNSHTEKPSGAAKTAEKKPPNNNVAMPKSEGITELSCKYRRR